MSISRGVRRVRARFAALISISLIILGCGGCGGGAGPAAIVGVVALIGLLGATSPVVVPLVVFPGGNALKPAALLPFSGEVNAVTVTPDGSKLYVADNLHNTVSVIETSTRQVIAVLDVPTGPRFLAATPDGNKVLVSSFGTRNLNGNLVTIIDTASDTVVTSLTVEAKPFAIAITPNSSKAFVVNSAGNSVSVIDLSNNSVSKTIDAGDGFVSLEPVAIVISSDGAQAFVANRGSNDVAIINTQTENVARTEAVGATPTGLALLPDDSRLYVSNRDDDTISVLNTSTGALVATLPVSAGPMALVASMDGERVYVAHGFSGLEEDLCGTDGATAQNRVSVIDVANNAVLPGTVTVGDAPLGVVVTGDNAKLYSVSACSDSATGKGSLSRLETDTITDNANLIASSIETVARGTGMVLSPDSFELFITHPHAVSVLDVASDTIVDSPISVRGAGPTKLALTANGTKLYSINTGSDSVSVIDVGPTSNDGQFLSSLPVGSRPSDLAITTRPANNQVVVTNAGFSRTPDTRISVIDVTGTGIVDDAVDTISLTDTSVNPDTGRGPVAVAISSDNTKAFVANFGDFFPNDREPGFFLSQVDLQTPFQVTNFNGYGEWLLSVTIDPDTNLAGNGDVVVNFVGEDVIHTANFLTNILNEGIVRGKVSDPATTFQEFVDRPIGVALSESRMVVAGYRTNDDAGAAFTTVSEFDVNGNLVTKQLEGANPGKIAVTPDESTAFVLHSGDRSFSCGPADDEFCNIGNTVSVIAFPFSNVVSPITVPVGQRPTDIAITPDLPGVPKRAYVTNYFDGTVSVIEPWTLDAVIKPAVVAILNVGKGPSGVVVNEQGTRAYVANSISNSISVISIEIGSPGAVVGTITVDP